MTDKRKKKTRKLISGMFCAALCLSLASCSQSDSSSAKETKSDKYDSSTAEGTADRLTYEFDRTLGSVEVNGKKFEAYINRPIRFDFTEKPYEEWLAYESPFDECISLFCDDGTDKYTELQTAAFAIRYAYENDIEYLDFPLEYTDSLLNDAWHFASLSYPNIPDAVTMSTYDLTNDGYTRIKLSDSVRKCASATETIDAAKEIIAAMPEDCVTDAEKAYYLYDWVCRNVGYDTYHAENNLGMVNAAPQSAYGALVDKRAVCDGIAGAIQLLFNMAGIDCVKIDADDLYYDGSHVWNLAVIDGEVWDFDATWDIYNCYESETDEITEYDSPGYYEWFGVERGAKSTYYNLTEMSYWYSDLTESKYTEKSPVMLVYDYCISSDEDGMQIYKNGKLFCTDADTFFDDLKKTPSGEMVALKFNTDSEGFVINYSSMEPLFGDTPNASTVTFWRPQRNIIEITAP